METILEHFEQYKFKKGLKKLFRKEQPFSKLYSVLKKYFEENDITRFKRLCHSISNNHIASSISQLATACLAARRNELDWCDLCIQRSARLFLNYSNQHELFDNYDYFQRHILQQAVYFHPDFEFDPDNTFDQLPELDYPDSFSTSGDVIVSVASGLYFDKFAKNFLNSCDRPSVIGGIYLHIVNPTENTKPLLNQLEDQCDSPLNWTLEEKNCGISYLTCSRFALAHELMENLERNIIVADLDLRFLKDQALSVERTLSDQSDGGLFERDLVEMELICHCPISYWRNNERTTAFLRLLSQYYSNRLSLEDNFWLLDQIGLYVLSRRSIKSSLPDAAANHFKWENLSSGHELENFKSDISIDLQARYDLRNQFKNRDDIPASYGISDGRIAPAES
jgi:hypothetical protein